MDRDKKKLNNHGFSLVEILVSVTILAIVLGPLLHSFIVSQRITNKSHFLGEGTLTSRNIIETIKADNVSEILKQVEDAMSGAVSPPPAPFGGTVDTAWLASNGIWDDVNGTYRFLVRNIETGFFGNSLGSTTAAGFDAIVEIDASPYRVGDPLDPMGINDRFVVDYTPMDTFFVQPRDPDFNPDNLAVENFIDEVAAFGITITEADVAGRYNREIILDIERVGGNVSMSVTFRYTFKHTVSPNDFEFEVYYDIYWESDKPDEEVVVYLFYLPYYGNASARPDTIIINNSGRKDPYDTSVTPDSPVLVKVFAVKQVPLTAVNAVREANYRGMINQWENPSLATTGETYTTVISNFRTNFYGDPIIESRFSHWKTYSAFHSVSIPIESDLLVTQTQTDRMFDISIEVYRAGDITGQTVITFKATHLE